MLDSLLEIQLKDPQDFLKIKETLTRIGIAKESERILWQSCHILHKRSRYYVVHFKELFSLDGKEACMTEEDLHRRNLVAKCLCDWGLCVAVNFDPKTLELGRALQHTKILKHHDKIGWALRAKHSLGNTSRGDRS